MMTAIRPKRAKTRNSPRAPVTIISSGGEEGEDTGHAGGQVGDGRRLSVFVLRALLLEEAEQGAVCSGEQREEALDRGHEGVRQEVKEEGKQFLG